MANGHGDDVALDSVLVLSNVEGDRYSVLDLQVPLSSNHCTRYGLGCGWRGILRFLHSSVLAKLWQLTPSMMTLMDLPFIPVLVWKRLHHWSSSLLAWVVKTLVTTSDGFASCAHESSSCSSN